MVLFVDISLAPKPAQIHGSGYDNYVVLLAHKTDVSAREKTKCKQCHVCHFPYVIYVIKRLIMIGFVLILVDFNEPINFLYVLMR
jgi:hypothetical protein